MRRIAGIALVWLGLSALVYAQSFGGFPPGTYDNTAAMQGVACVPSTAINFDFTTGSLPAGITFTRSGTNATYINVSGVLTTASANAARFNYDANYPRGITAPSLTGPFLLYEPTGTNLALQSNTFTTTWFATSTSVATSAQFTSPDGTNDGWSFTAGSGFGGRDQQITVTNQAYNLSVWAKTISGSPHLGLKVGSTGGGSDIGATSATIIRYRLSLTPAGGSNTDNVVFVDNATGPVMGVFGAQLETGAVSTSYITTTTGSANRSADAAAFTIPSCVGHLTVTFDDNSTQSIAVSPGAYTLTTTINRPNIKTIVGAS